MFYSWHGPDFSTIKCRPILVADLELWIGIERKVRYGSFPQRAGDSNGLNMKIETLVSGAGPVPKQGDTVNVHYTGWLTDGTKFDSSVDRNEPFAFVLGTGQVIRGWDQGVAGMKVGDKTRFTIPPDLAYGEAGYP